MPRGETDLAGCVLCAAQTTVMTGNAAARMDAPCHRQPSAMEMDTKENTFGRKWHEALADRFPVADRGARLCATKRTHDSLRLRPQSAEAAAEHVFRRSVGRGRPLPGG